MADAACPGGGRAALPAAAPRTVRPADFASAPEKGFARGGLPQATRATIKEAARAAVRGSKSTEHNLFMAPANTDRIPIVQALAVLHLSL